MTASINSIIYQLRICRQKTINISPFEANFGRKANTPLNNVTTKLDPKSLTYKKILNKYLDLETVRWEQLISDENCDNEGRSDTEVELNKDRLSKDATKPKKRGPEQRIKSDSSPRCRTIRATNRSIIRSKTCKTKTAHKTIKEKPRWVIRLVGARFFDGKNAYIHLIKEPGKRDVTIRNSDLAKFGTNAERQTELQTYAN